MNTHVGHALLSSFLVTAALVLAPRQEARDLEVRSLTLVDESGRPAARLSSTPGGPALVLFEGENAGTVVSTEGFVLFGQGGIPRLALQDLGDGGAGIAFRDAEGKLKLSLRSGNGGIGFAGESAIMYYDGAGAMRGQVRFEESAGMMVGLHDRASNLRVGLRLDGNEDGNLMFLHEDADRSVAELLVGFDPRTRKPSVEAWQQDRQIWGH